MTRSRLIWGGAIVLGAIVLWLLLRESNAPAIPTTRITRTNTGLLDGIQITLDKLAGIFRTTGGGPVYTDPAPGDSNTLPGNPTYGPML